jgi:hypothetical protein
MPNRVFERDRILAPTDTTGNNPDVSKRPHIVNNPAAHW